MEAIYTPFFYFRFSFCFSGDLENLTTRVTSTASHFGQETTTISSGQTGDVTPGSFVLTFLPAYTRK